jgi:hypothetical protein
MKRCNKKVFGEDYIKNLKEMLQDAVHLVKSFEGDEGIHVVITIEKMQEISDYCKNLGISDKVFFHDIEDKDKFLEAAKKQKGFFIMELE